jgi:signal transduction histidine kinase
LEAQEPAGERGITALVALGLAAWHLLLLRRRRPLALEPRPALLGWWAVTIGLAVWLIARDGSYVIVVYALYPLAFVTLDRWGIPVVAAITGAALLGAGVGDGREVIYSTLASTVLALAIALFITAFARQREELAEALETNRRLQERLVKQARAGGVLEERARMAREIHDTVAQGLTSVVTQLEAADQRLQAGDGEAATQRVAIARTTARESLSEVRRSVADLRPELLDGGSLAEALRRLSERTRDETGLAVDLAVELGCDPLSPASEMTLLRCAQEALANVRRHSGARAVAVRVRRGEAGADLVVTDDGSGFDPEARHGGAGLLGMAERAAAVGGRLDVRSAPGSGTMLRVSVPA